MKKTNGEMYFKLETLEAISVCPICGSVAELWKYAPDPDKPASKAVMCTNSEAFGPQVDTEVVNTGCPFYMPPDQFYQPTAKEAIKYWNEYALALVGLRHRLRFKIQT